jgi:hypothetical protein
MASMKPNPLMRRERDAKLAAWANAFCNLIGAAVCLYIAGKASFTVWAHIGDEASPRLWGFIVWLSAMSLAFVAMAWASWRGKPWAATTARRLVGVFAVGFIVLSLLLPLDHGKKANPLPEIPAPR